MCSNTLREIIILFSITIRQALTWLSFVQPPNPTRTSTKMNPPHLFLTQTRGAFKINIKKINAPSFITLKSIFSFTLTMLRWKTNKIKIINIKKTKNTLCRCKQKCRYVTHMAKQFCFPIRDIRVYGKFHDNKLNVLSRLDCRWLNWSIEMEPPS